MISGDRGGSWKCWGAWPSNMNIAARDKLSSRGFLEQILYIVREMIIQALQGRIMMNHAGHACLSRFNGLWS